MTVLKYINFPLSIIICNVIVFWFLELFEDGDLPQAEGKPRIKSSSVSPPLEVFLFPEEVQLLKTFQAEIERIGIRFALSKTKEISKEVSVLIEGLPSVFAEREFSEVKRGRPSVAVNNVKVW